METVAVLVDGDNLSAKYAAQIVQRARGLGATTVRRVYLDAQRASDWQGGAQGFRLMHAGTGKNASDLLLTLDAMELALRDDVRRFVIASSDRDFSHLALRLREYGRQVTGVGEAKTPQVFREACETFIALSGPVAAEPGPKPVPKAAASLCPLDRQILALIAEMQEPGRGLRIVRLNELMASRHKVKIGTLPERSWRAYLQARAALYDLDPRGPEARVRARPAAVSAPRVQAA